MFLLWRWIINITSILQWMECSSTSEVWWSLGTQSSLSRSPHYPAPSWTSWIVNLPCSPVRLMSAMAGKTASEFGSTGRAVGAPQRWISSGAGGLLKERSSDASYLLLSPALRERAQRCVENSLKHTCFSSPGDIVWRSFLAFSVSTSKTGRAVRSHYIGGGQGWPGVETVELINDTDVCRENKTTKSLLMPSRWLHEFDADHLSSVAFNDW